MKTSITMRPNNYQIYSVGHGVMMVTSDILTMGWNWPPIIKDPKTGRTFKFLCNEPMEGWMVGNRGGHAKYVEMAESATLTADSAK